MAWGIGAALLFSPPAFATPRVQLPASEPAHSWHSPMALADLAPCNGCEAPVRLVPDGDRWLIQIEFRNTQREVQIAPPQTETDRESASLLIRALLRQIALTQPDAPTVDLPEPKTPSVPSAQNDVNLGLVGGFVPPPPPVFAQPAPAADKPKPVLVQPTSPAPPSDASSPGPTNTGPSQPEVDAFLAQATPMLTALTGGLRRRPAVVPLDDANELDPDPLGDRGSRFTQAKSIRTEAQPSLPSGRRGRGTAKAATEGAEDIDSEPTAVRQRGPDLSLRQLQAPPVFIALGSTFLSPATSETVSMHAGVGVIAYRRWGVDIEAGYAANQHLDPISPARWPWFHSVSRAELLLAPSLRFRYARLDGAVGVAMLQFGFQDEPYNTGFTPTIQFGGELHTGVRKRFGSVGLRVRGQLDPISYVAVASDDSMMLVPQDRIFVEFVSRVIRWRR